MPPGSPPQVLQIFIERVRPGCLEDYGRIEQELLHVCRRLGAPNRYLALVSQEQPTEVWWLNMYDSPAEVGRIAQAYAANTALMAALAELSARKNRMTEPPVDLMTELRGAGKLPEPWRIGELPYAVVQILAAPASTNEPVFAAPDGRGLVLKAAADADRALEAAAHLGEGARIFAVEPAWSYPKAEWAASNPALWNPGLVS